MRDIAGRRANRIGVLADPTLDGRGRRGFRPSVIRAHVVHIEPIDDGHDAPMELARGLDRDLVEVHGRETLVHELRYEAPRAISARSLPRATFVRLSREPAR